jgi:methylated-DNA-protein-cysteine methyltransferase-like protein
MYSKIISKDFLMPPGFSSPPNKNEFNKNVWEIVRQIPYGKVTTYGKIASMITPPQNISHRGYFIQSPRWVGGALASCPDNIPWHRVVNSKGKISIRNGDGHMLQKNLLEAEGVIFDKHQRISFAIFGWNP